MTEKEAKILAMQQPSTRKCLERPKSEDIAWWSRPMPKAKDVTYYDENGDVFINSRPLTFQEAQIEHGIRHKRGERLAEMRNEGDAKATSDDRKLSAAQAFMERFSPEAIKRKFKEFFGGIKTEKTYAERVAEHINRVKNEK